MIARELPVEEWRRLAGTPLGTVTLRPDCARVLVVEDGDRIVGCWALLSVLHAEGVWVDEPHRKKGAVARRLYAAMARLIQSLGASQVVTAAEDDDVAGLLTRHGAQPLPTHYLLPLGG